MTTSSHKRVTEYYLWLWSGYMFHLSGWCDFVTICHGIFRDKLSHNDICDSGVASWLIYVHIWLGLCYIKWLWLCYDCDLNNYFWVVFCDLAWPLLLVRSVTSWTMSLMSQLSWHYFVITLTWLDNTENLSTWSYCCHFDLVMIIWTTICLVTCYILNTLTWPCLCLTWYWLDLTWLVSWLDLLNLYSDLVQVTNFWLNTELMDLLSLWLGLIYYYWLFLTWLK